MVGSDVPALAPAGATGRDDDPGAAVQNRSMLLGLEEAGCQSLAQALMEQWAARWPGDGYRMAPYDQIQAGFRNAIMGIELRR